METAFETTILGFGNNTGIEVPTENGVMSGRTLISLPKAHREASGLAAQFEGLSYFRRRELARQVDEAKADVTRERRIGKVLAALS